jgi:hypothetical protein
VKEKTMHETESILDKLGLRLSVDWTVDALHLLDDPSGGWRVVLLVFDNAYQRFLVAEQGQDDELQVSDSYGLGDTAWRAYVDRIAARLFRHYNSAVPALSYERENKEDRA